jgi:hypothetical protein
MTNERFREINAGVRITRCPCGCALVTEASSAAPLYEDVIGIRTGRATRPVRADSRKDGGRVSRKSRA